MGVKIVVYGRGTVRLLELAEPRETAELQALLDRIRSRHGDGEAGRRDRATG
jgi:hypothetical protein